MDVFLIRDALAAASVEADVQVVSDGEAAIRLIDAAEAGSQVPPTARGHDTLVLIVSSSHTPRDAEALKNLAISGYFKKPSDYKDFLRLGPIVRDLLAQQQPENPE